METIPHIPYRPEHSQLQGRRQFVSVLNDYLSAWEDKYGTRESEVTLPLRFKGVIARAAEKEGRNVVILVDEYDKPILQTLQNEKLQEDHRNQLKHSTRY